MQDKSSKDSKTISKKFIVVIFLATSILFSFIGAGAYWFLSKQNSNIEISKTEEETKGSSDLTVAKCNSTDQIFKEKGTLFRDSGAIYIIRMNPSEEALCYQKVYESNEEGVILSAYFHHPYDKISFFHKEDGLMILDLNTNETSIIDEVFNVANTSIFYKYDLIISYPLKKHETSEPSYEETWEDAVVKILNITTGDIHKINVGNLPVDTKFHIEERSLDQHQPNSPLLLVASTGVLEDCTNCTYEIQEEFNITEYSTEYSSMLDR